MEINEIPKQEKTPSVLVGCPTFSGMSYCLDDFIKSIKTLTYKNHSFIMVDNSSDSSYYKHLKSLGICVIKDTSLGSPMQKVASSRNIILDYASDFNFDFLLMLDQDVIPPKDIIEQLLHYKKDIISGLYYNYFDTPIGKQFLPVAYTFISEEEFKQKQKLGLIPDYAKTSDDLKRKIITSELEGKDLLMVKVPSAGCMLISKTVFNSGVRYSTYKTPLSKTGWAGDEMMFCKSAREAGFKIFLSPKTRCEHLIKGKYSKDKDGNYIHSLKENQK